MIRPTPSSTARAQLGARSCCCRGSRSAPGRTRPARATVSSPPEQTSRQSPSSATQRATVGAQERLAGVEDVVRRERVAEGAGPGPEVGLVEDVRRGAVLGDQVGQRDAADARARRRPCAAVVDHRCGTSALGSVGWRSQAGPRRAPGRRAPSRPVRVGTTHIRSGAETPSRPRPLASTVRVAATSTSRARCRSAGSSSPSGSTRHSCRRTGGTTAAVSSR